MICSEALEKFLINQQLINNSKETILYYKKRIGYFICFVCNKDILELNLNDYNNYVLFLQEKKPNLSSFTIKTMLNSVKIFLKWLFDNQYISNNFYCKIKPYKTENKTIVVLSDSDIHKLLSSQNEFDKVGCRNLFAISLMLDAGLRVSEVCNLNVDDISEELQVIRVFGKGRKERLVPLTDTILNYYKRYMYISKIYSGALFLDFDTNTRLTTSGLSQMLRKIKKEYNFDKLHPHFLRHTFATLFLVNGGDPVHLQLILGHTTLYMTEHYIHLANQYTLPKQKKFSPLSNLKNT